MKNTLFMVISSFLPFAAFRLFAQANSSMAQPQPGQPQRESSLSQSLEAFSLPSGTVTENDMPKIKKVMEQVLSKISESMKSAGKRADYQTIKSGILTFQDWLKRQVCVSQLSTTYNIESTDKYSDSIFMTHPGQLPFDIVFNMEGGIKKPYRMMMFVDAFDLFNFGMLVENRSINGVPVPKSWPKDSMSYWENKL
jgi:hypothetical protein